MDLYDEIMKSMKNPDMGLVFHEGSLFCDSGVGPTNVPGGPCKYSLMDPSGIFETSFKEKPT